MGSLLAITLSIIALIHRDFLSIANEDKIMMIQCSRDSPLIIWASLSQQGKMFPEDDNC